ncbi:MAG: hypothetical protein PHF00_05835 [Elusimicrobia bacterium]|nr:hypothetical protein [Elusimicrobiota bacterium]
MIGLFLRRRLRDAVFAAERLGLAAADAVIRPLSGVARARLREEVVSGRIRKVLVNRSDGVGDAVVCLPLLRQLARRFEDVRVLASAANAFVFREAGLAVVADDPARPFWRWWRGTGPDPMRKARYALAVLLSPLARRLRPRPEAYDLLLDLVGDPLVRAAHPARWLVGRNLGPLAAAYDAFAAAPRPPRSETAAEECRRAAAECLGLDIPAEDEAVGAKTARRRRQILFLVGGEPRRQLDLARWSRLLELAAAAAPCLVADDERQAVLPALRRRPELAQNARVTWLEGARPLAELARIASESALLLALDGGAEHYLQRFTNAFVLYTCGLPAQWRPPSRDPYRRRGLPGGHVYEETVTSDGLDKMVLYRGGDRKPCYNLLCDDPEVKGIDPRLAAALLRRARCLA